MYWSATCSLGGYVVLWLGDFANARVECCVDQGKVISRTQLGRNTRICIYA